MKKVVMYGNPTVEKTIEDYIEKHIDYNSLSLPQKGTLIKKLECSCKSCDLHYCSSYKNIPAVLNSNCQFVFIGRNPNGTEAKENALYPQGTPHGRAFEKYLELLGIGQGEISILNMCNCYAKGNRPPTQEEINKCVAFKKFEFEAIGSSYKIIFPMSQDALKWIYGVNHPGSMQCHGKIFFSEIDNRVVAIIPLIHPSQVLIDKSMAKEVGSYLKELASFVSKVREVDDLNELCKD